MDRNKYDASRHVFDGAHVGLSVIVGDVFNISEADCMVTAGNSFGMMDGGIDGIANYRFGMIESRVQDAIVREWHGEIPVGAALTLPSSSFGAYTGQSGAHKSAINTSMM